ncbi:MAG: hypothetical protein K8T26_19920 [Lentisphaerae bacterium]|nr:hypothetical protein [Lentisphaerota bacterium]
MKTTRGGHLLSVVLLATASLIAFGTMSASAYYTVPSEITLHPDQQLPTGWQWHLSWRTYDNQQTGSGASGSDSALLAPCNCYHYTPGGDSDVVDVNITLTLTSHSGTTTEATMTYGPTHIKAYFNIYMQVAASGTIAYSGTQTGQIQIVASNSSYGQSQWISGPGTFTFSALQNYQTYSFTAFRDSNGNGVMNTWEARGSFSGNPRRLSGSASSINMTLTDPTVDTDRDGLTDYFEVYTSHTNPTKADSDNDQMPDGWEVAHALDPLIDNAIGDPDFDFLSNLGEYQGGSDPHNRDTDDDGLADGEEVHTYHSDPTRTDTDGDGLSDGQEVQVHHCDPTKADSDGDGTSDGVEISAGTDPNNRASFPVSALSGRVTYSGSQIGVIRVVAASSSNAWNASCWAVITNAGAYVIVGPPTLTNYWIKAHRDSNTNGVCEFWEAWGSYALNPIYLTNSSTGVDIVLSDPDTDSDGMPDWWEVAYFGGTNRTDASDADTDGLNNRDEFLHGTDPTRADTDADGLSDGDEVHGTHTDPHNRDTDGDGLSDGQEVNTYHSDPTTTDTDDDGLGDGQEVNVYNTDLNSPDTDGDSLTDGQEINTYHSNPKNTDTDGDGVTDGQEVNTYHSDPTKTDTDGDGLSDGQEVNTYRTDPTKTDTDEDGLSDSVEVQSYHTDPSSADTDGDGLSDGQEVNTHHTNPNLTDSDRDGMPDGWEAAHSLDPLANDAGVDTDGDGLPNLAEYQHGADPDNVDTDSDGMNDGYEVVVYQTNPTNPDTDSDGVNDWAEVSTHHTDPNRGDSDEDGMNDGNELIAGTNPTNRFSVFRITAAECLSIESQKIVSWSSVTGRYYRLERSTNLALGYTDVVKSIIPAHPPLNTETDLYIQGAGPCFYRVSVFLR